MLQEFVHKLARAVREEMKAEIEAVRREIQTLSGEDREKRGRAILDLRGKKMGDLFDQIVVRFGRAREIRTDIKSGDVVIISRGNPLQSDLIGTVIRVGKRFVDVALPVLPAWAKRGARIDLYADDTTFRRWTDVLESMPENAEKAMKLALGMCRAKPVRQVKIKPINSRLDRSKIRAVERALGAEDFYLIHGPFGTGKTTALAELILQLVKEGYKVLATAETNVAVDNLVERLYERAKIVRIGNPARVNEALLETTVYSLAEKHPLSEEVRNLRKELEELGENQERFTKPVPKFRRGLTDDQILELAEKGKGIRGVNAETVKSMAEWIRRQKRMEEIANRIKKLEEQIVREVVNDSDVVLTTNSSAALEIIPSNFDVAVIDEATQATIPSVLLPISKAKKFVLAGDHKQLPPTILSPRAKILERTLFEMLIERYPDHASMLEVQYRMNERLAEFPSKEFYEGRVKTADSVRNITLEDMGVKDGVVMEFIDTAEHPAKWDRRKRGSGSFFNPLEARIVKETVVKLISKGAKEEWIGVITPYDAQRDLLREELPEDVEINTVDGYQGREKEIIVISFVRSNPRGSIGFLRDLRRLNVALTRARRKLIVVGDSKTLGTKDIYARLIQHIKENGKYVLLDE